MSKRAIPAFFLLLAAAFLLMNRGAYKGYFTDDEIDNVSWTPHLDVEDYAKALVTPRFIPDNFRPAGHFYFRTMEKCFGSDFPKYVLFLQLFHLLNLWLLWVLARKLGARPLQAAAAVTAFALHMALFDAVWKPMYVFDVLCATFCLVSFICYVERRWVLSLLAFWVAYKSKELAVMLPAVLACYELWLGERRWKPLVPFFLVSLSFGLQGILLNPNKDNDYTFRFTLAALAKTSVFYAGKVLLIPYAGFALLVVPFVTRHKRAWLGLAMAGLFAFPLLFLPGRIFSAYCYVPFTGLAVALSALDLDAPRVRIAAAALFLLWFPWNFQQMRLQRRAKLGKDAEVRTYMTTLERFAAHAQRIEAFVYAGAPGGYNRWGMEGAIKHFFHRQDLEVRFELDKEAPDVLKRDRFAMLTWDWSRKQLFIAAHTPETPDAAYLTMDSGTPVWQLGTGWHALEDTFRWMSPGAKAHLYRPAGARRFQLRVNIGPTQIQQAGVQQAIPSLNGQRLEPRSFPRTAWQTVEWDLPPGAPGEVEVQVDVKPGFTPENETRVLGLAVGGFGFVTEGKP